MVNIPKDYFFEYNDEIGQKTIYGRAPGNI